MVKGNKQEYNKEIGSRIADVFWNMEIRLLTITPIILGLLLISGWIFLSSKIFDVETSIRISPTVFGISSLLMSLSGVAQIWRREAPGNFGNIFGIWPIISGALYFLFFLFMSIFMFISPFID